MFIYLGLVMVAVQGGYMRRMKPGGEKAVAVRVSNLITGTNTQFFI